MSTLNTKTHAHITAYEQYIANNNKFKDLALLIDKNVKGFVSVYDLDGRVKESLKAGDAVGQISEKRLYNIENVINHKGWEGGEYIRTSRGYISIFHISKPHPAKDVMDKEHRTITQLNDSLKTIAPARIYVNQYKYFDDIQGARKVPGTPKADMVMYGKKQDVYVSLKDGERPKDFQQLCGLSAQTGMQRYKEVIDFLKAAADASHKNNDKLPYPIYRPIRDMNVIFAAVFGPNFTNSVYGVNNCNMIAQGNSIIEPYKEGYMLNWTGHVVYNNREEVEKFFKDDNEYRLVFGATFRSGYPITIAGSKIANNIRTGIYTIAKIKFGRAREI